MNLREQISSKCIFFTGVQHAKCACGIPYEDVRVGKPYRFPCLNQDGSCEKRKFLTKEEVDSELQELEGWGNKLVEAVEANPNTLIGKTAGYIDPKKDYQFVYETIDSNKFWCS